MANTTDIMIITFFDDYAISFINSKSNLDFRQVTDGEKCGGSKVSGFEAYGFCARCIGRKKIDELIMIFRSAPFASPEYAVMVIDDDNEDFNGIITIANK